MSLRITDEVKQQIAEMAQTETIETTAKALNVSVTTVSRYKAKNRKSARKKLSKSKALVPVDKAKPVSSAAGLNHQEGITLLRQARTLGGSLKSRTFLLCMLALNSLEGGQP